MNDDRTVATTRRRRGAVPRDCRDRPWPRKPAPWGGRLLGLGALLAALRRRSLSAPGVTRRSTTRSWQQPSGGAISCRASAWHGQGERQHHGRFLAGHDLGVSERKYLRPRQRLYRQAQRRYRRPGQAGRAARADHRARARSSDPAGRGQSRPDAGDVAQDAGKCRSGQRHLAARQAAGRKRLGDPATGRHRPAWPSRRSRRRSASPSEHCRPAGADSVLHQQKDYQSVVAPFDGVITQRNIDVGSLVQADATSGTFMFTIMQSNVIRTLVYVPQDSGVRLGARCRGGRACSGDSGPRASPARSRASPMRCSRARGRCSRKSTCRIPTAR